MSRGYEEQDNHAAEAGSSKRYQHFYSALQLATRSAASKWTYEDFQECFPTYCQEFPTKAQTLRTQMAKNIYEVTKQESDQLLAEHNVAAATDVLHEVVLEGRAKRRSGQSDDAQDVWSANITPWAAVHARTVPVLETERDRLLAELERITEENEALTAELEQNEFKRQALGAKTTQRLDLLDQMVSGLENLPLQDIEQWAMDNEESLGSRT